MSQGLADAGIDVLGAAEINELRATTYQLNHPAVVMFNRDVRQLKAKHIFSEVSALRSGLDLLSACPPCQGFSRIRRRNSKSAATDDRNDLIFDVVRLTRELNPRVVLVENVPGLEGDSRFHAVLAELEQLGYGTDWGFLNTEHFGVPQRRRRLVLIGIRGTSQPSISRIPTAPARTVRDAIGRMPPLNKRTLELHSIRSKHSKVVQRRIALVPKDGGSRAAWPESLRLDCHNESAGFRDVYGRMKWDDVAPTITGGCTNPSKGRFLHPIENRSISVVEAAMLQTFPANYRFPESAGRTHIAEMIGEAVPPRFARQIGKYIVSLLGTSEERLSVPFSQEVDRIRGRR